MIDILVKNGELHIKSEYMQEFVQFMRSRPTRFWDKINRLWILPESDLENLIKFIVSVNKEYSLKYDTGEAVSNTIIPEWYEFKTKPFEHQIDGVKYGLDHPKFLLADEQGLGKTKQILDLSCILKNKSNIKHVLIITGVMRCKHIQTNQHIY